MKRGRQEGRKIERLPLKGSEAGVNLIWNRRTKGGERERTKTWGECETIEGDGERTKMWGHGKLKPCNKRKGKTKKFKVWKQRVLQRISVEKALGLGFMVELNLEEVGFMVKIGLEFILYLSTF